MGSVSHSSSHSSSIIVSGENCHRATQTRWASIQVNAAAPCLRKQTSPRYRYNHQSVRCIQTRRNWVQNVKGKTLTNAQLKARRIWHKGSVLTWGPYLKSILYYALHIMTNDQRDTMLYRPAISEQQKEIIRHCLSRIFAHPMCDNPEPEIDSLLAYAKR